MDLMTAIMQLIIFGPSAASLLWFLISLILYLSARRRNRENPDSVDAETMRARRSSLIGSAVSATMLVGSLIAVVVVVSRSVSFM